MKSMPSRLGVQRRESNAGQNGTGTFDDIDLDRRGQALGGQHHQRPRAIRRRRAYEPGVGTLRKESNSFAYRPSYDVSNLLNRRGLHHGECSSAGAAGRLLERVETVEEHAGEVGQVERDSSDATKLGVPSGLGSPADGLNGTSRPAAVADGLSSPVGGLRGGTVVRVFDAVPAAEPDRRAS
jgi:hypothetical protein